MKLITISYLIFFSLFCHATSPLNLNKHLQNQNKNNTLNISSEDLTTLISPIPDDSIMRLQNLGIEFNDINNKQELLIRHILKDSPAAEPALHARSIDTLGKVHRGDIIIKINNKVVTNSKQLKHMRSSFKIGAPIVLTIIRNNHKTKIKLKYLNIA